MGGDRCGSAHAILDGAIRVVCELPVGHSRDGVATWHRMWLRGDHAVVSWPTVRTCPVDPT